MEVAECTKILSSRIQKLEPENFTKIIGCLLLSYDEHQIIKFAYAPDEVIHGLIVESMMFLSSARKPNNSNFLVASPPFSGQFSSPSSLLGGGAPYSDYPFANDRQPLNCHPLMQADILNLEEQLHSMKLSGSDYPSNYYNPEMALGGGLGLGQAAGRRARSPPNVPEFPSRACHYFYRGFCRHGINCRYSHGPPGPDDFSMLHGVDMHEPGLDDHVFELEALEKLEMEIIELLRARRGMPVSIAALPMIYHERYGKTLQAEGYLTESQRHGKTGISLTRLLARLKNVRLIDRPHGQHSVVLTEDVPKYVDYRTERDDMGVVLSSSNQIYLTFPAESTFTEEDIASYFKRYGPVCDVRVPRQERRMFGFVTFLYPETVRLILSKGHPHYICGARVLVKPYKEKTRSNDKRYAEKMETPMYYPNYPLIDPELNSFARVHESPSLLQQQLIEDRKQAVEYERRVHESPSLLQQQLIEDRKQAVEYERRRLCDMWLSAKSQNMVPYSDNRLNELNIPEDHSNYLPALKISSPDDEKRTHSSNSSEKDSPYKLPESPFSHPR